MTKHDKNEVRDPAGVLPALRIKRRKGKSDLLYYRWKNPDGGTGRQRFYGPLGRGVARTSSIAAAFDRFRLEYAEHAADGTSPVAVNDTGALTVRELTRRYRAHLDREHGADWCSKKGKGNRTHYALQALADFTGAEPVEAFGPKRLKAFRAALMLKKNAVGEPALCLRELNARISRVVACFAWAVEEELATPRGLESVKAIRTKAGKAAGLRVTDKGATVPVALVAATLPHLSPLMADVVRLLSLTGARPSELLGLSVDAVRGADKSDPDAWSLELDEHKSADKDKSRVLVLTPAAQAIIAPYLIGKPQSAPVFPGRSGGVMDHRALARAVARACKRGELEPWTPYMIRRTVATEIAERMDPKHAAALLGHADTRTTERHYIEAQTRRRAIEAAKVREEARTG